jgi:hypothetical protein
MSKVVELKTSLLSRDDLKCAKYIGFDSITAVCPKELSPVQLPVSPVLNLILFSLNKSRSKATLVIPCGKLPEGTCVGKL